MKVNLTNQEELYNPFEDVPQIRKNLRNKYWHVLQEFKEETREKERASCTVTCSACAMRGRLRGLGGATTEMNKHRQPLAMGRLGRTSSIPANAGMGRNAITRASAICSRWDGHVNSSQAVSVW